VPRQYRERGLFREWYKVGHAWIETAPEGQIIRVFQALPGGSRRNDGFICCFPVGTVPPDPPPEAKRPGQPSEVGEQTPVGTASPQTCPAAIFTVS